MKERGIIFRDWEVRAILDGRKTMFRRVVKPQPHCFQSGLPVVYCGVPGRGETKAVKCPFGTVGDRLYVKEAWRLEDFDVVDGHCSAAISYRVDLSTNTAVRKRGGMEMMDERVGWRSPATMPRWASRLKLEIVNVRVERVQDITEQDAIAEGVNPLFTDADIAARPELASCRGEWNNYLWHGHHGQYGMGNAKSDAWPYQFSSYAQARDSFSSLWELIHGPGAWDRNDWVWAVTFKRLEGGAE